MTASEAPAPDGFSARPFGRRLSLQRPHLCPEIGLWLLAEEVDLETECDAIAGDGAPPYWAFAWGSGQALARYVLDHPDEVAGRRVVDFGAGSGIVAVAAAMAGAQQVVAVDLDPTALLACRANARENGVAIQVARALPERCDLLLASDVLYEAVARPEVASYTGAKHGALAGEPARPGLGRYDLDPVTSYAVTTLPDVDSPTSKASIYRLSLPIEGSL
jgi:predicted nicotinamide N-methyase